MVSLCSFSTGIRPSSLTSGTSFCDEDWQATKGIAFVTFDNTIASPAARDWFQNVEMRLPNEWTLLFCQTAVYMPCVDRRRAVGLNGELFKVPLRLIAV